MRQILCALFCLAAGALRSSALVVPALADPSAFEVSYTSPTVYGMNLNGVVQVKTSTGYCSGALLADGFSILTAGHCVASSYAAGAAGAQVGFLISGSSGVSFTNASLVFVNPEWDGNAEHGGDLAVLRLPSAAPSQYTRYNLFTGVPTVAVNVLAGYGLSGTGDTGFGPNSGGTRYGNLRAGLNRYELSQNGLDGNSDVLLGDFVDGTKNTNAFCWYFTPDAWANDACASDPAANPYFPNNSDIADYEVMIAPGDSGGPTFQNGLLVGVHDYFSCFTNQAGTACAQPPSAISNLPSHTYGSAYGQYFGEVSVPQYADWIQAQEVPEPASCALALAGLALLARRARARAGVRRHTVPARLRMLRSE